MHSVLCLKQALVLHWLTTCCFVNCIGVQDVVDAIGKLGAIYAKKQPLGNAQVCVCVYVYMCVYVCAYVYVCTFVNTPSHFHCMMKQFSHCPCFVRV